MTEMQSRFSGQVAIVTGSMRGIGCGIARRLAAEGCRVVVWDLRTADFDAAAAGFEPALRVDVDVSDYQAVEGAAATTLAALGQVDILVNNAGVNGPVVPFWDYPLDAWDKVIAIDLTGVFYCCRALIPSMRARHYGRVLNIASIAGKEGMPGLAAYSAAKAGVIGLTKSMARDLTQDGVLVNALTPVITETDLFKEMTPEHIASAKSRIPLGRFLTIDEIASTSAWIVSRECSFNTGFAFDLSGGRATY